MMERSVKYHNSTLHYDVLGSGSEPLLLFHGFGQDRAVFNTISTPLFDVYTIYVFDLFFHGQSTWADGEQPLEKSAWKQIMASFIENEQLTRFSMAGFSMGARFALATFESFPEKTHRLFLIAPDGIRMNAWYTLLTYPVLMRKFFKSMILNHDRFVKTLQLMSQMRLVKPAQAKFAVHQMSSEPRRRRVYYSWVVFRLLKFDLQELAALINSHETPVIFIVGKYDHVISVESLNGFLRRLKNYKLKTVDSGHLALMGEAVQYLLEND
jgi:pimeloyl-ACP methyl ester carboxylesterase